VQTYSRAASNTNFEALLRLVAPSAEPLGATVDLFNPGFRFRIPPAEMPVAVELCQAHRPPVVTAITGCTLSVCLDWYAHPDDSEPPRWIRTELGALVYRGKYQGAEERKACGPVLAERAISYVDTHPVLRAVTGVAPVPSSQVIGPAEPGLVRGIATLLARHLGVPIVNLERVHETAIAQKALGRNDDADGNQAGTMRSDDVAGGSILAIDDLMRHGSTVSEAARALRSAGAKDAHSLTLVKERTGTRGYAFA